MVTSDQNSVGITLVLGGARSGKSRFAENLMPDTADCLYIATAEARDDEMRDRIASHQERRGNNWITVEEPLNLAQSLTNTDGKPALVDCLTLWLSNLMGDARDIHSETQNLLGVLETMNSPVVIVSNEVGQGIVPANAMARQFRDHAGQLNQAVAAIADNVFFVTAGIPTQLK
ncbi:MAG: bifunctional adenosylcobinamide kinase/adenosylcobinamide-phosphate guanylyltransferase [Rhodospirillaceae bacterium]|nr:bifunctional adenosylcobinamide kinase/adenosylcobinamide-phosphate guanylyltransferase [Rhodospirillaceae bacterium]|tara:strand:+ start:36418 stop:36939 length:522 start_codon:yes stop_codon:yes gene_type:complete